MALSIKLNTDKNPLLAVADTIKCKGWGQQLEACGVILEMMPKALIMRHKGALLATTVVNSSAIKLLVHGNLQAASKMMLSEKLRDLYETAINHLIASGDLSHKVPADSDLTAINTADPDAIPNKKGLKVSDTYDEGEDAEGDYTDIGDAPSPPPSEAPVVSSSAKDVGQLVKSNPVKLASATTIGQPVKATSPGSVYHVVGLSKEVNAAARLKINGANWSLAVRFEGPGLKKAGDLLKAIGATPGDSYSSLHLSGDGGSPMAMRALGAVLIGSGLSWASTMSPCHPLINAGA